MIGRQYNFSINTFHGLVNLTITERQTHFDTPKVSHSFKQGDKTCLIVGASNQLDAMLAAFKQLQLEMKDLQKQVYEKYKEIISLQYFIVKMTKGDN